MDRGVDVSADMLLQAPALEIYAAVLEDREVLELQPLLPEDAGEVFGQGVGQIAGFGKGNGVRMYGTGWPAR